MLDLLLLVNIFMGNRGERDLHAIRASMETAEDQHEEHEGEVHFSSKYVHEFEGVPNTPEVIAAIDAWADAWGEEIVPVMKDEGLYDVEDPAHVIAMEKFTEKVDVLKKVLPGAKILIGLVTFDGGHVQLSA